MATVEHDKELQTDTGEKHEPERDMELDEPARRGRSKRLRLIIFAVLILAVIVAIPVYNYYSSRESTDDAQVDGHIVPISPRITGTVIAVLVNDNQYVTAGTELVRLDPADYRVAADKAAADLADAQAQTLEAETNVPITQITTSSLIKTSSSAVSEAQAGVIAAQRQVDAANARVASANAKVAEAQANNDKAQKDLARMKELVDKDEISRQQYDAAIAAAQSRAAEVDTAKAAVNEAQHNVDVAQANLTQARARLNSAGVQERQSQASAPKQQAAIEARFKAANAMVQQRQAAVNQARLNLEYTTLRAPVSGLISKKNAEPGMIVAPGQQLMSIVPLDGGRSGSGCIRRTQIQGARRQHLGGFRCEVQLASTRKRHRELRQSGAARPRENSPRPRSEPGPHASSRYVGQSGGSPEFTINSTGIGPLPFETTG